MLPLLRSVARYVGLVLSKISASLWVSLMMVDLDSSKSLFSLSVQTNWVPGMECSFSRSECIGDLVNQTK